MLPCCLVPDLLPSAYLELTFCQLFRTLFASRLNYRIIGLPPPVKPSGYCSPIEDHACWLEYSSVLSSIYLFAITTKIQNILVVINYVKQQQQQQQKQWGTLYLVLYQVLSCKLTQCTESVTFLSARAAGWPGDFWFWHLGWHTRQLVHQEESRLLPRACPYPTTCCRAVLTLSGFENQAICIHNKDSLWINVFVSLYKSSQTAKS